jgi:hypothetical protein
MDVLEVKLNVTKLAKETVPGHVALMGEAQQLVTGMELV